MACFGHLQTMWQVLGNKHRIVVIFGIIPLKFPVKKTYSDFLKGLFSPFLIGSLSMRLFLALSFACLFPGLCPKSIRLFLEACLCKNTIWRSQIGVNTFVILKPLKNVFGFVAICSKRKKINAVRRQAKIGPRYLQVQLVPH